MSLLFLRRYTSDIFFVISGQGNLILVLHCVKTCHLFQGQDETVRIVSMNKDFHVKCYVCEVCDKITL